jgi:hypothetical protein
MSYTRMFHLFQTYVASVLFGCCKTRSGCCIYMQVFQVFSYVCCKCFILMFAYVCNGHTRVFKFFLMFCKCFKYMLQVLQLFWTYIANILFGCCKSRSGAAHVAMHVRSGHCRVLELAEPRHRYGTTSMSAHAADSSAITCANSGQERTHGILL